MERSLEQPVVDPTYLEFFGLTQSPFARLPDPGQLFHSEQYSLLTEHLANAATNTDSLVVIFGADGSGKSTLINRFVTTIGDQISCVVVDETCHGEEQFYSAFLTQIGFEEITGTATELRNITKEFLVCRGIANDHVLIIIDNAHLADPRMLEQLRWLCEIKIKDRRVLSVVLVGNADIVRVVDAPAMRKTRFRSHVVFGIRNYSEEETANYVWHRLRLAGGTDAVKLPNEASSLIHRYSGGVPHLINRLCDDMLVEANSLESRVISEKIVRIVADKQQLLPHVVPFHGKGRRKSDPDFKHVRVVPKTAGVDSENLQQQIARLSEQLGDLRADKARALQDIDARNDDITALRDEIVQQNLALSNNATALEGSENRSEKLASDLEKVTRARDAAQKELAKTKATVEELNQLNRELQSTADNVQADLEVADERAVEIEVLEKRAADLKDELEGKTGEVDSLRDELASRNEILADLEMRLERSQSACELAQQRIAALKSPLELEEIEKASDKLAADLRIEKRARKAAEKDLAKTKAIVEELDQLRQELHATGEIEALEKTTADLKDELEGKTRELDSLRGELKSQRDELASRNEAVADLERWLKESQAESESAQQRINALRDPEELEAVERTSDKLAFDLEKETRAREAAQKELAKATATIEELNQLKQELQATIDGVQADLKAADERAVEIEVLEKNAADLETRLEESQAECESAQQRINALRDPEELEAVERASDKLAADLRKEKRARKAAQKELAKTKATVDELDQLKQELQGTVRDLNADLKAADERAVEIEVLEKNAADLNDELEGKTGELDSLRDELKSLRDRLTSRDKDVTDLERWLQESQKERAAAQLRINDLKDPEELEEVERASDKLASDLEKEVRAREAAEKDLAKTKATVDELNQLKQELQGTVRDLNADLRVAGERAVEFHVLERNVTDLKEELEKKSRVLESRNQALADLEKQLEASQNECDSLRRRAPAVNTGEEIVAEQAIPASGRDTPVHSSHVVAMFEQSLSDIPAYQTLREYDPAFYDGLIVTYKQLVGQDLTDKQVSDALRAKQAKLMERLLPGASDEAIIAYAQLIVDQLDELRLDGIEPCLSLLIPQAGPHNTSTVYSEITKGRELDTLDVTLRTYHADRQLPAEKDVWPDLGPIFEELFDEFGADNVAAMENSYDPGVDRGLVCNVTRALYSGILKLPERSAANALRWLLST